MTTGVRSRRARSRSSVRQPSQTGIITSRSTRSKWDFSRARSARASSPFAASAHAWPDSVRPLVSKVRVRGSSSTTRILMFGEQPNRAARARAWASPHPRESAAGPGLVSFALEPARAQRGQHGRGEEEGGHEAEIGAGEMREDRHGGREATGGVRREQATFARGAGRRHNARLVSSESELSTRRILALWWPLAASWLLM